MTKGYDAFLSHNTKDKPAVRRLVDALEALGLNIYFDERDIRPGIPAQDQLEEALKLSKTVVVVIGLEGLGRWQTPEVRTAINQQIKRNTPVIPVLLPGVPDNVEMPGFLQNNTWVSFKKGLDDKDTLNRLYFGITGINLARQERRREQALSTAPGDTGDATAQALADLSDVTRSENLTIILGRDIAEDHEAPLPRSPEITRNLLNAIELIARDTDPVLLPPIDVAANYYAIQKDERRLEDQVVELIIERSTGVPTEHRKLAQLICDLRNHRRRSRRARFKSPQLIVTTNFDVMMERALLMAGISFTRIVQHRAEPKIHINEYKDVSLLADGAIQLSGAEGRIEKVAPDDYEAMDRLIEQGAGRSLTLHGEATGAEPAQSISELSLNQFAEPILYKFLGSQDIPGSCTISTDQYFNLLFSMRKRQAVPSQIREIISNTPLLFLGFGILDPDFRLSYHVLMREPLKEKKFQHYGVHIPREADTDDSDRNVEARGWERIKHIALTRFGIQIIEEGTEAFVDKFAEAILSHNGD